jgi:anti-sigma-K factor RskA
MDCEQLDLLYEEYALGILEGEERAELEAHLASGCAKCTPGVARARYVVSQLALAAPDAEPPAALRGKIMDAVRSSTPSTRPVKAPVPSPVTSIEKPQAKRPMFPAWAWAAAAALALMTGYSIHQMELQTTQLAELRREMNLATQQSQSLQNQLDQGRMVAAIMMSPDSMPLKLMPKDKNMPMVHAYLNSKMGVAVTADEMPSMPAARALQLWLVPKNGKPMSAGVFRPDAQGQVTMVSPVNIPMDEIAALAVTEEPAGGSPQPTSAIAWMAQKN